MGDKRIEGLAEEALGSLRDALAGEYELRDELGRGSSAVAVRRVLGEEHGRPVAGGRWPGPSPVALLP